MNQKKGLLFIAGDVEIDALFQQLPRPEVIPFDGWNSWEIGPLTIIHTGIGAINAACAAHTTISQLNPDYCLQLGLSGAHLENLEIGEIILGTEVKSFSRHTKTASGEITPRANPIQIEKNCEWIPSFHGDPILLEAVKSQLSDDQLNFHQAIVGSADQFNRDPVFLKKIQSTFGTWCEDMESSATAHVAYRLKKPFLSIRVISNNELAAGGRSTDGKRFEELAFHQLGSVGRSLLTLTERGA